MNYLSDEETFEILEAMLGEDRVTHSVRNGVLQFLAEVPHCRIVHLKPLPGGLEVRYDLGSQRVTAFFHQESVV